MTLQRILIKWNGRNQCEPRYVNSKIYYGKIGMICLENLRKLMGIFDHFKGILTGLNINLKTLRT
jgi:hypothetical protein